MDLLLKTSMGILGFAVVSLAVVIVIKTIVRFFAEDWFDIDFEDPEEILP